ncbi:MAG TPA: VapC toxin family PIN domain ribonuclease [Gammaproteobacteria bacterium]|nr:VapC toxin family PIN domain ribonuclease [Gammaproteobacteria bacterium]
MNALLDTCLPSELLKRQPKKSVVDWLNQQPEKSLFLSVLTLGELQKGIAKLIDEERSKKLQKWLDEDLSQRFADRILGITPEIARAWGILQGQLERQGKKMPIIDGLIATTAQVHDLVLVT